MERTRSTLSWIALASLAGALAGCDGTGTSLDAGGGDATLADGGADGGVDGGPIGPVQPVFDPSVLDGSASFFDFPYPSDLRVDADGRPQLDQFPHQRGLVAEVVGELQTEHAGFSPITGVYFRFTGPLDESALPAHPADTQADGSLVLLVDVDPDSPERGRHMPAYVHFQHASTAFWQPDTLVVRAVPGVHLHPGRRYAAVIRAGITAADGTPVEPSPAFVGAASSGGAVGDAYTALMADLADLGIAAEEVLVASAFTVSDTATQMDMARAFIEAQPLPEVRSWRRVAAQPTMDSFEAELDVYELFGDAPPYTAFGTGRIAFDASGQPLTVTRRTIHVGLTIPTSDPPAGGYPVVLYGHGTGGDDQTHFGDEGAEMAKVGVAMLGFDAALHGLRAPPGVNVESLILTNPVIAREVVRQTVIDAMLLFRMLAAGAFTVPADVSGGAAVTLASSPVLYMGHSQGSQEGGLLLGLESTLQAAFLSEGGGGAIISIVQRDFMGQPIACTLAPLVSETCADLNMDHPLMTLLVQPLMDPADPLSFAHRFVRERPADWAPLSIAMTEGTADMYTPPATIEALAATIGLPVVNPVVIRGDALRIAGLDPVTAPVTDDITMPSGATAAGGLMQWSGADHFAIYSIADAKNRYVQFLQTAAAGTPTIVGPM